MKLQKLNGKWIVFENGINYYFNYVYQALSFIVSLQKIETILDKSMSGGFHEIEFNGENLNSGMYLLRINAGVYRDMIKMVFLK